MGCDLCTSFRATAELHVAISRCSKEGQAAEKLICKAWKESSQEMLTGARLLVVLNNTSDTLYTRQNHSIY